MGDEPRLSDAMFAYHRAESEFGDKMVEAGFGDYCRVGGDDYDNSIEFYDVAPDARMGEAAQRLVVEAGFGKAYVNHKDGWETHYTWKHGEPFKAVRGWRRRWVADPNAKTNRGIGHVDSGYYEISYWPESWNKPTPEEWLVSGYMRIVPDPLDVATE